MEEVLSFPFVHDRFIPLSKVLLYVNCNAILLFEFKQVLYVCNMATA